MQFLLKETKRKKCWFRRTKFKGERHDCFMMKGNKDNPSHPSKTNVSKKSDSVQKVVAAATNDTTATTHQPASATAQPISNELRMQVASIYQEAEEKIEELEVKTEEEFKIEKARIVSEESEKINKFYLHKHKEVERQKRIRNAQIVNGYQIQILNAMQEYQQFVLQEALTVLKSVSKQNKAAYQIILQKSILQGLLRLVEPDVVIQFRECDKQLVEAAIEQFALPLYRKQVGKTCEIKLAGIYLSNNSCGGVILRSAKKREIKTICTLDARLHQVFERGSWLRERLFGVNPRRVHRD